MNKGILCLMLTGLICIGGLSPKSYANENTEKLLINLQESKTQNGWVNKSGTWYYYKNGVMQTGWKQISGKWYYLNSNGAMQKGWKKLGSQWYYLKTNGEMAIGWLNLNGTWYYLNSDGAMATGWKKLGSQWYFLKSDGAMQKGWLQIQGQWYYFYGSGVMATNTTIDGWKINASGIGTPINTQRDEYTNELFMHEYKILGTYLDSMTSMMKQGWRYAVSYAKRVDNTLVDVYNLHLSINSNSELYNGMTEVLYNLCMYNKSIANSDLEGARIWLDKLSDSLDKIRPIIPRSKYKNIQIPSLDKNIDNNKHVNIKVINNEVEKLLSLEGIN